MRFEERSLGGKSKGVSNHGHSLPDMSHQVRPHIGHSASVQLELNDSPADEDELPGPASAMPTTNWGRLRESMPPAMGPNGEAFDYVEMLSQQSNDIPKCVRL
jgi:hypothetical protein